LTSRKNRFDCEGNVSLVLRDLFQQLDHVGLTRCEGVIIPNPNKVCVEGLLQDFVSFANGLEGLEFFIEFVDILPARRNMDFPDVRLDSPDGFPLECRNLPKSLL